MNRPVYTQITSARVDFAMRREVAPNRIAMTRATYDRLFEEMVAAGPHPFTSTAKGLTEIAGMRIDIDAEAIVPVVSRIEAP